MPKCTKCTQDKDLANFYPRLDNKKGHSAHCRACHNANLVSRHRDTRKKLIDIFGGRCQICGFCSEPLILQFHHRDPSEKKFKISKSTRVNHETLIEECNKCDLLCPNCHAIHHLYKGYK